MAAPAASLHAKSLTTLETALDSQAHTLTALLAHHLAGSMPEDWKDVPPTATVAVDNDLLAALESWKEASRSARRAIVGVRGALNKARADDVLPADEEFGDSTVLDSAEAVIHQAVEEAMAVGDPTSDAWRAAVAATDKITQVIERGRKDGSSSSSSSSSGHAAARAARHDADAGDDEDDDEELLAEVDHEDTERDVTCPLTKKVFEFPVRMRDGCEHTFERAAIEDYIARKSGNKSTCKCPVPGCGSSLRSNALTDDALMRERIRLFGLLRSGHASKVVR